MCSSVGRLVGRSVRNAFVGGQKQDGERLLSCIRTRCLINRLTLEYRFNSESHISKLILRKTGYEIDWASSIEFCFSFRTLFRARISVGQALMSHHFRVFGVTRVTCGA